MLTLLGAVLVLFLLGGAGPASAHAVLRGSDPADGTVLKSAPGYVTLTFSESVGLLDDSFRVYDPGNRQVDTGEARPVPGRSDTARVRLPAGLGQGTFTVAWRVVSADSHPVSGAFTYSVGKPSVTAPTVRTGPAEDPVTGSLYDIARYVAYVALALLIGTVTFRLACRPPDSGPLRAPALTGWWALLAATAVLLVLRAPYEEGTGPASAFGLASLSRTTASRPGLALLARLALLLVAGALLWRPHARVALSRPVRAVRAVGAVWAVALALTWASAEHASAGIQVPVAMAASVLHLLAMAVWLGGLAALLGTLYRSPDALPVTVVTRFSRLAFASVTVLVVTGVYQAWRGLGSWDALTGTSYGRILIAKSGAVALLLAAANRSRRWTARLVPTEAAESVLRERVPEPAAAPPVGDSSYTASATSTASVASTASMASPGSSSGPGLVSDHRSLRRSVLAEAAVAAVVLVISTALASTLPGRASAEASASSSASASASGATSGIPVASVTTVPFAVGNARGKVQITLDPGRVGASGKNSVQAVVFGADGGFATVPELRLSFTLPARNIGPIDAGLTDKGGYWGADSVGLPMPGTWTMKVTVRVSALDQVTESRQVRIPR
ncbi:copper resistance protein CopC [Streptomyces sp. NPDC046805]|uniref:copper resistance CopC/CopD family protein n=1 Tax=Streptomyces sp. NPDC046805 TaxID=3155134 RepID=UPI0033D97739